MTCNCMNEINEKLDGQHLHALHFLDGRPSVPVIALMRNDNHSFEKRSGKPHYFAPRFCPFCGTEYQPQAETETSKNEVAA